MNAVTQPSETKLAQLHPRRFFLQTWRTVDREAELERAAHGGYDYRPLVVFVLGGICLTLMEYFGSSRDYVQLVDRLADGGAGWLAELARQLRDSQFYRLSHFGFWALARVLGYFVVPALCVKLVFRERLADYGLRWAGFAQHAWLYALCYGFVFVLVVLVSFNPAFTSYYPFYKGASRSWLDFGLWELLYAAQFFSLEFFYRGFWLSACRRMLGSYAIPAMIVPYCMVHYGKPWSEAIGALGAGVVLGTLAFKTRSIWSGFLIHVSVAMTMDSASLLQNGTLPTRLLPWPYM